MRRWETTPLRFPLRRHLEPQGTSANTVAQLSSKCREMANNNCIKQHMEEEQYRTVEVVSRTQIMQCYSTDDARNFPCGCRNIKPKLMKRGNKIESSSTRPHPPLRCYEASGLPNCSQTYGPARIGGCATTSGGRDSPCAPPSYASAHRELAFEVA